MLLVGFLHCCFNKGSEKAALDKGFNVSGLQSTGIAGSRGESSP